MNRRHYLVSYDISDKFLVNIPDVLKNPWSAFAFPSSA